MISPETLEEVKNRLVKTYAPLEIYLFGSYAWGNPEVKALGIFNFSCPIH